MRLLRNILIAVVIVIAGLAIYGFSLPREVSISRSIEIAAAPDAIFPFVNDLKTFNQWSPWSKRDPDMEVTFSGPENGVGQTMMWKSDESDIGSGTATISESIENERVVTDLQFDDFDAGKASFILDPRSESTNVTWSFMTDLGGNPFTRYAGLLMESWVGDDYETGLADLKQLVESQPKPEPAPPVVAPPVETPAAPPAAEQPVETPAAPSDSSTGGNAPADGVTPPANEAPTSNDTPAAVPPAVETPSTGTPTTDQPTTEQPSGTNQ